MKAFLIYLFWPNPANATYGSPKALALLILCGLFLVVSIGLRLWRRRVENGMLRKFVRSWSVAAFWFGVTGLVMVVARAEEIQYLSMRFLWVVWGALLLLTLFVQIRVYRGRYYQVMPTVQAEDPREKYLPGRKK